MGEEWTEIRQKCEGKEKRKVKGEERISRDERDTDAEHRA